MLTPHGILPRMTDDRLAAARARLVERINEDRATLAALEADIARRSDRQESISMEPLDHIERATPGQAVADTVARVGGSWTFVITFFCVLVVWMITNTLLASRAFDPYPFILLNLVLSCLAAVQAPIIMMSQNRVSEIDRRRAEHDYRINVKAETEVASLHLKVDHMLHAQFDRTIELHEAQLAFLEALARERG